MQLQSILLQKDTSPHLKANVCQISVSNWIFLDN